MKGAGGWLVQRPTTVLDILTMLHFKPGRSGAGAVLLIIITEVLQPMRSRIARKWNLDCAQEIFPAHDQKSP